MKISKHWEDLTEYFYWNTML